MWRQLAPSQDSGGQCRVQGAVAAAIEQICWLTGLVWAAARPPAPPALAAASLSFSGPGP